MTLTALRVPRNVIIALFIALTITLAPIVRADTVRFVRTVFGAPPAPAAVNADLTPAQLK